MSRGRVALMGLAALVGAAVLAGFGAAPAQSADLTNFRPGAIISDAIFYDSTTMTAAQIDAFLDAKGSSCTAGEMPCLKDYTESTVARAADSYCSAYEGAASETAGQIIVKVAVACRVNPQVLVVMLQKEQGLVTATKPTSRKYNAALGFKCPDTAACDPTYAGFSRQVYYAARQLQVYAARPTSYNYRKGMTNTIQYHPNVAACGTTSVYIENQATASLYNYTPYTPNAAALAAGYGKGDSCSSYGNRNFYLYFNDWFGPSNDRQPTGYIDSVSSTDRSITVSGWALDPDTTASIPVHLYLDGVATVTTANGSRPDLDAIFHKGAAHGFTATVTASVGRHEACLWALNDWSAGVNVLLGCRTVEVRNAAPVGGVEIVEGGAGSVRVVGWAYDPDTNDAATVEAVLDGTATATTAGGARADIQAAAGHSGPAGFDLTAPAAEGSHTLCVRVRDTLTSAAVDLGCRQTSAGPARAALSGTGIVSVQPARLLDSWVATVTSAARCTAVSGSGVPGSATGVMLTVTTAGPSSAGNVVVFPDDGTAAPTPPLASTVNFEAGREVANSAWVKVGANGRICWAAQGSGQARVLLDVTGYTTSSSGVVLQQAQRLLDTRAGSQVGELRSALPSGTLTDLTVAGRAGVPANAVAVVLNVTAVNPSATGYLGIVPAAAPAVVPAVSTLNYAPGQTKASLAVVPLGVGGRVSLYSRTVGSLPVDVVVDVLGYVGSGSTTYHTLTPTRVLDSRSARAQSLVAGRVVSFDLRSTGAVPASATGVIATVTAVGPTSVGNLRVYPDSAGTGATTPPGASTLSYIPGRDIATLVVVGIPADGRIDFYSDQPAGGTSEVLFDIVGYTTG